ncbi:glycosyltransferase family 4 protein [uncultured Fusobacterium sp.]|uniref:glycosyltransferase family 4 protein n=1 Tax=uncultured Fusobacterium sp. TaxID=159267 RepID=UPI0025F270C2|nr:glycosyltransferase family 4 protein [uncultured Fusobacterium sp.]
MKDKVVYMISSLFYPSIGGVENHIYNLSKTIILRNKTIKVKVIKPVINLEQNNIYILDGIEIHEISVGNKRDEEKYNKYKNKSKGNLIGFLYGYKRKYFFNKYNKILLNYIENDLIQEKKDFIIHQHDFISNIILSKKLSKKYKIIFTNHTGEFLFLKKIPIFNNIIIKLLTRHFSFIIGPSDELSSFETIRKKDTYCYLSNGVDTERFSEISEKEKEKLKVKFGIESNKIIVFSPRRWAPTKGIIYLVKAIKLILDSGNNNLIFYFAGNDYLDYIEYKKEIMNYIEKNNLSKYIKLLGDIDYQKIDQYYKVADIVVLPSLMEAVSLGALEAMACEKIMIGTNVGGFPQIITNEENGILVKSKNEKELFKVINDLSKNIKKYRYLGINARKFIEKTYDWNNISDKTIEIYNKFWNKCE